MCFAMRANHDMRRSIYEARFVKCGPLGKHFHNTVAVVRPF
jgi:hypothetical protein